MNRIQTAALKEDGRKSIFEIMESSCPWDYVAFSEEFKDDHECEYVSPSEFDCLECWQKKYPRP